MNCLHVLPELHRLEQEFGANLTVLGIHSAKFENEKDSAQIVQAIEKYGIHHPVANDADFAIWKSLGVNSWPSFALVSADGRLVELTSGEEVYKKLRDRIAAEVTRAQNWARPTPFPAVVAPSSVSELRFPGKLLWDSNTRRLIVSDTEHHRIRVFDDHGLEVASYGSGLMGFKDGPAGVAQFHSPQGLAIRGSDLFVADTENHALRRIDLAKGEVSTLFGNGKQSRIAYWRETLTTELNSPWDLAWHGEDLLIAMAGTHQIYRVRWDADAATLERWIGSGVENLLDGAARRACLAQTSGLATHPDGSLYFVDSETSSLRQFHDGQVTTLVGQGLFDFGFRDGRGGPEESGAQLQHPLGVAVAGDLIYVADAYNHAIRVYDLSTRELRTLAGGGSGDRAEAGFRDGSSASARFREPNGLALDGTRLFVADTNNHAVRVIDLTTKNVTTWPVQVPVRAPRKSESAGFLPNLLVDESISVAVSPFRFRWSLPAGFKLNPQAPSRLSLRVGSETIESWDLRPLVGHEFELPLALLTRNCVLEGTLYPCPAEGDGACQVASIRLALTPDGFKREYLWELKLGL